MSRSHRLLAATFVAGLAAVALFTWIAGMPVEDVRLVPCPVHAASGVPCPGCGMTRACVALARGEVAGAWSHHPFAYLVVPLALAVALAPRRAAALWRRVTPAARTALGLGLVAACLGQWALRLA